MAKTVYNKTTEEKRYGEAPFELVLPASNADGARGAGVRFDNDRNKHYAIGHHATYRAFLEDVKAGRIEVVND